MDTLAQLMPRLSRRAPELIVLRGQLFAAPSDDPLLLDLGLISDDGTLTRKGNKLLDLLQELAHLLDVPLI